MSTDTSHRPTPGSGGISYHSILLGALSFTGGVVTVLITMKALGTGEVTFSVTGIVSFLFGIALASASIVLAIAAISLGRTSERTMVERSDESIRLQNEVFLKTTEALGRIESSTGITEKRIEDIIAGRAGAIAERLVEHRRIGARSREDIEREIRQSVRAALPDHLRQEPDPKREELDAKINEAWGNYLKFRQNILFHMSDHPSTKTRKIGFGNFNTSGDDLADGVFETPSGGIAVYTFATEPLLGDRFGAKGEFGNFIYSVLADLESDTFHRAFVVFDGNLDPDSPFTKQIQSQFSVAKNELVGRVDVVSGELPEVMETLSKALATSEAAA